jgi:hypothetical protein
MCNRERGKASMRAAGRAASAGESGGGSAAAPSAGSAGGSSAGSRWTGLLWVFGIALVLFGFPRIGVAGGEEARGMLRLSTGEEWRGAIYCTGRRPLKVFDLGKKQYRYFRLTEIHRIRTTVEKEETREKWRFREEGSDEKVYTGKTYPRRFYRSEITLRGGERVDAHIVGVVYVERGEETGKFVLRKKHVGKVGQDLDDLVYVEEILFTQGESPGQKPADERTIYGAITPPGGCRSIRAVKVGAETLYSGELAPAEGRYVIRGLPEGWYDLVVETREALYLWLSPAAGCLEKGRPDRGTTEAIERELRGHRTWIDVKRLLFAVGDGKRARVIVEGRREGRTSFKSKVPLYFRRILLINLHRTGDRWIVDGRLCLLREKLEKGKSGKKVRLDRKLGGKAIGKDRKGIHFDYSVVSPGEERHGRSMREKQPR